MSVITRSNHPDDLWPGVKLWFGKNYKTMPAYWSQIFEKGSSDKYQEIIAESTGFGLASVKNEGSSIAYDTDMQGTKNTLVHVVYGLGYIVSREEIEDNQYGEVSEARAKGLAFSIRTTVEMVHANIFNRAFSASYTFGDGKALCATDHVTRSGSQSNRLATDTDFSEASLEDSLKDIMQFKNSRGLNIAVKGMRVISHTSEAFNVARVLKNAQWRPGTANRDINAVVTLGLVPQEPIANPYFTDLDAWFIQTDVADGLLSYWRREASLEKDSDFDTENAKAKSTVRFVAGPGDWRCLYGTPGG